MSVNRIQLYNELLLKIENDEGVHLRSREFAERVKEHWKSIAPSPGDPGHPYATGAYKESITIRSERGRDSRGRFIYHYEVGTNDPKAHFLEYGTGPDKPGSRSPWGPNTSTPAFAFAARTAVFFNATGERL